MDTLRGSWYFEQKRNRKCKYVRILLEDLCSLNETVNNTSKMTCKTRRKRV